MTPKPTKETLNDTPSEAPETSPERIATAAYFLWEERGCPDGSPEVDWFKAEEQLRKDEQHQES
jgi:hypothetical protein